MAVGAGRIYDGIASLTLNCSTYSRILRAREQLKLGTFDSTLRWFLDQHPEVAGPAPDPGMELPPLTAENGPNGSGRCESTTVLPRGFDADQKRVRCRKRGGHSKDADPRDQRHAWWARGAKPYWWTS